VLKGTAGAATAKALRTGLTLAALLVPVQIMVGDLHGLNTLQHQPQKIAAIEAIWHTERAAPLLLFAWPDEAARENRLAIAIPKAGSLILAHDPEAEIRGLNEFEGRHPPVKPLFFGFRLMVGMGLLMLATSWTGWWLLRRRAWHAAALPQPLLRWLAAMTFSGWVATLAGWYVTEIGRQPYIVFGLLKTSEVVTHTPAPHVALTLAAYLALYGVLIVAYVAVLKYLAEHGSRAVHEPPGHSTEAVARMATTGASR
jgi:cytochrome d ubiquinol oxidase subunit I